MYLLSYYLWLVQSPAENRGIMAVRRSEIVLWVLLLCGFLAGTRVRVESSLEIEALMDIKAALDPSGKILHTWTGDGDPCSGSFEGVFCNSHGKVGNISLQAKGLSGSLSPSIVNLRCLSGLFLHYNNLSGSIPKEIGNLTELVEMYLNLNSLTGIIPPELSSSSSLQVLQLCCNQLTGPIPSELGSLKKLSVLALQRNRLMGAIPSSLGELKSLNRLDLSFNNLTGAIPRTLASLPELTVLNVKSNDLSGRVPQDLEDLREGFQYDNNSKLCGAKFFKLPECNSSVPGAEEKPMGLPNINIPSINNGSEGTLPDSTKFSRCQNCSSSHSHASKIGIVCAVIALLFATAFAVVSLIFAWHRRQKQKVSGAFDSLSTRPSTDQNSHYKEDQSKRPSPLVLIEYSSDWDSFEDRGSALGNLRINFGEIENATNNFSEKNLLGRNDFTSVYKGVLREGTAVSIKCVSKTSCKIDEFEFREGLKVLIQIRHPNIVNLRGFCCSKARSECFLVYEFVENGTLLQKLKGESGNKLSWSARIKIVHGIAKGMEYLHHGLAEPIVHQNLTVANILLDEALNPKITDCALQRLLADDVVFSILKNSAALGCLAPEYAAVGRLTLTSDIYAFGKLLLHVLTGISGSSISPDLRPSEQKRSVRTLIQSGRVEEIMDSRLSGNFVVKEAAALAKIALDCTHEIPGQRPSISAVVRIIENEIQTLTLT